MKQLLILFFLSVFIIIRKLEYVFHNKIANKNSVLWLWESSPCGRIPKVLSSFNWYFSLPSIKKRVRIRLCLLHLSYEIWKFMKEIRLSMKLRFYDCPQLLLHQRTTFYELDSINMLRQSCSKYYKILIGRWIARISIELIFICRKS